MKNISCLFNSAHNIGNHFINWSMYFLSGDSDIYYFDKVSGYMKEKICMNPISKHNVNAHNHYVPQNLGYEELKYTISSIPNTHDMKHVQFTTLTMSMVMEKYMPSTNVESLTQHQLGKIDQIKMADLSKCVNYINDNNYPLVYIKYNIIDVLSNFYNNRHLMHYNSKYIYNDMNECMEDYEKKFFNMAKTKFKTDFIWDRREKLALNIMPFYFNNYLYDDYFLENISHITYDTIDIFDNLNNVIRDICSYCNIHVDESRFEKWIPIYNEWKKVHDTVFSRDFWKIIDAINNNEYMELSSYNIDFYKEVLILYGLMYKYDMNIKSWTLEKFPLNTQKIHLLLEKNIHERSVNFSKFFHKPIFNEY